MRNFRVTHLVGMMFVLLATCAAAGEVNPNGATVSGGSLFDLVQQKAAPEEYLFQKTTNGFSAVNALNRLNSEFTPGGVRLSQWDAVTKEATGSLFSMNLAAFGRQGALRETAPTWPELHGERVEYSRAGITEWYRNSGKGFEQGFNIPARLEGEGELCVLLETDAAVTNYGKNAVRLLAGERKLSLADLVATDATGQKLDARLEAYSGHGIRIYVDDRVAAYPIVIDPVLGDENWVRCFCPQGMGLSFDCSSVSALVFDSLGNLYAGGNFTMACGVMANSIAKWDGSSWSALGSGTNACVSALAFDSMGNLYAGGYFTTAGGVPANCIAMWNGSAWSALSLGMSGGLAGFGGPCVNALAFDSVGNLYAGGNFTTAGGAPANFIAEWSVSAQAWSALGSGMSGGAETCVYALAFDRTRNLLYAGGCFATADDVTANGIAMWDGSGWHASGSGMSRVAYDPYIMALACDSSGNLYAGGVFTAAGDVAAAGIARWDGSFWHPLGSGIRGINGEVTALAFDSIGNLYAGGTFTTAGGTTANCIAEWNVSAQAWSALGSGMGGYGGPTVLALACDNEGKLNVGGYFFTAGALRANNIAKWDGSSWTAFGQGLGTLNGNLPIYVYALAFDNAGHLYAGGNFTSAGGMTVNGIAMWNGSRWFALGSGLNGTVYSLTCDSAGNLYAGGQFSTTGDGLTMVSNIAEWDGSAWSALDTGLGGFGINTWVDTVAFDSLGNIYAGGNFTMACGVMANSIAKWDGSSWSALGSGTNACVSALAFDSMGNLYAGGYFTTAGGVPANCIAMWNSASGWSALGSGMEQPVYALACDNAGNLYASGPAPFDNGYVCR